MAWKKNLQPLKVSLKSLAFPYKQEKTEELEHVS